MRLCIALAIALSPALNGTAQTADRAPRAVRTVAAGVASGPIVLDGRLDDAAWQSAPVAGGWVQQVPVEGAPAVDASEARVLFDDQAVYIAGRMYDSDPSSIARQMVRRDVRGQADDFMVAFDTNLDQRTGYLFAVSAANVQWDAYLYDDREIDGSWDAVWTSAIHIDDQGWTVEIRIPLSQMRYVASDAAQTWGTTFVRHKISTAEETHFALISQLENSRVSQFGRLENVVIPRASRRLELRPYLLSSASKEPAVDGNPFRDGSDAAARTGLDIRYGIGAQFNLDATINPDFGQVEADPAVINLSAFETFFPERRPFFVEDARIFDFGLSGGRNSLFYSRRIGRAPTGRTPSDADFADRPAAATILGAAKLTGRTSNGLSVGVLTALTQRERGTAFFQDSGEKSRFLVEPRAGFGVVRLRQDFNGGATTIGAIGTLMQRDLPADGSFDHLNRTAINGGFDWEHQWADREWSFFGYVAGTHIRGDSTALIRVQRSSNHYFQRPDATRLTLDSTKTSMSGMDWRMTLSRQNAEHWTGSVWLAQVTPGFETNDLGFSSRSEVLDGGARITYRDIEPGETFRNYAVSFFTFHNWMHEALDGSWSDAHVNGSFTLRSDAELLNYWGVEASISARPQTTSRTATRGGPLVRMPGSRSFRFSVQSDRRQKLNVNPTVAYEQSDSGDDTRLSIGVTYRPSSRVEIGLEPEWGRPISESQYITRVTDASYTPTLGTRYIFGRLDRQQFSLETRVNVTINPRLSLQVFVQPLISAGDYTTYRQLEAPMTYTFSDFNEGQATANGCGGAGTCVTDGTRAFDFNRDGTTDATTSDRDFNVRSLIGNAVLRWEYRPGSTLFLVWQRQQSDRSTTGDFNFRRDVDALFGADAYNVFMLKLNYWFGV